METVKTAYNCFVFGKIRHLTEHRPDDPKEEEGEEGGREERVRLQI